MHRQKIIYHNGVEFFLNLHSQLHTTQLLRDLHQEIRIMIMVEFNGFRPSIIRPIVAFLGKLIEA